MQNEEQGDNKSARRVFTEEELLQKFGNSADLKMALQQQSNSASGEKSGREYLVQFIKYVAPRFKLCAVPQYGREKHAALDKFADQCLQVIQDSKSDFDVYKFMREQQKMQFGVTLSSSTVRAFEVQKYNKTSDSKLDELCDSLDALRPHFKFQEIQNALDIGTETLDFLDTMENKLKIKSGNVHGINIEGSDMFSHYDSNYCENKKDPRFQFYNGTEIKEQELGGPFDLITIFSVLHHVPPESLALLAKEIARVCKGFLFIKEVDLRSQAKEIIFRVQHYLFGGVLHEGTGDSYMNSSFTREYLIKLLVDQGFTVLITRDMNNFTGSFYCLLTRADVPPDVKAKLAQIEQEFIDHKERRWSKKPPSFKEQQGGYQQQRSYHHQQQGSYHHQQQGSYQHQRRRDYCGGHSHHSHSNSHDRRHHHTRSRDDESDEREHKRARK